MESSREWLMPALTLGLAVILLIAVAQLLMPQGSQDGRGGAVLQGLQVLSLS